LDFGATPNNHDHINAPVAARLNEQGCIYDGNAMGVAGFDFPQQAVLFSMDTRMDDSIEPGPRFRVGKDQPAEFRAVKRAVSSQYLAAESRYNVVEGRHARLHDSPGNFIGIEDVAAKFA
jgi:hypothetical protein